MKERVKQADRERERERERENNNNNNNNNNYKNNAAKNILFCFQWQKKIQTQSVKEVNLW